MMTKKIYTLLLALTIAASVFSQPLYKNKNASVEDRVNDLLGRMTLNEKIGQLTCPLGWEMYSKTGDKVEPSAAFIVRMEQMPIGVFWATFRADPWTKKTLKNGLSPMLAAETANALQKYAVEKTRLGIPIFFAEECPHGHMAIGATVFPTSIGQASTWNENLINEMAKIIACEARVQGSHIGYGPVLDLAREARWSRVEESFGEDPVLTGILGSAFVKGLQGEQNQPSQQSVYSTLKHFAAYGIPEGGHNGNRANVGERMLFSDFLKPFKMAVNAGAKTVMTSYNATDGVPSTSNNFLINDVLRKQWGFKGFLFSDLGSIEGIYTAHHVAADMTEASALALKSGVDVDLGGNAYSKNLEKALQQKQLSIATIDNAVKNVLRLKFEMGLFENPYRNPKEAAIVNSAAHKNMAEKVAAESVVLLKNNGILPLQKDIKTIAVIGPNADNIYNQLGDYTAPQEREKISTVLDGIRKVIPQATIHYAKGCAIRDTTQTDMASALQAAQKSDVVVLVLGGSSARDFKTEYIETGAAVVKSDGAEVLSDMESGEGFDRASLHLMGDQEKLLNAVAATGKPLIVVYIQGRPLNMNNASQKASALLNAWYPGEAGGTAIARILFGDYNPAGRLPISIPRSVGQIPVYYSQGKLHDYVEETADPLYAFGYGLSYTNFTYYDIKIEKTGKTNARVTCSVANTGNFDGDEVVQLYLKDNVSSVATPPIQLKKFQRIHLKRAETKQLSFELGFDELALYNQAMQYVVEPGKFTVMIGAASNDIRLKGEFEVE